MNRELLTRVLSLVRDLAPGTACPLTVEEAGVLKAFVAVRSKSPDLTDAEKALHAKILNLLKGWNASQPAASAQPEASGTDKRTQLALRGAIDRILEDRWEEVTPDDEHLVRATYEVVKGRQAGSDSQPDRLLKLLETIVGKLDARAEASGESKAEQSAGKTIFAEGADSNEPPRTASGKVLTAEEALKGGNRSAVSAIEGIRVDLSLRPIEYTGDVTIKGDVPSDVFLRVHKGSVTVSGFVAGSVVADGDVTIEGNTQGGIIVSRSGNISVGRALVKSILVAKQGDVRCEHLEDPECVFAWGTVYVDGMMMGGKICAAHIDVTGRVLSGELHSCGDIRVEAVESNRRTPSLVCLRKKLTCADYGREMDVASFEHQRRVNQLETEIDTLLHTNKHTHKLIHHCFRTALLYLVGGVESADSLRRLQGLQTKSIHLRQIISIAERVSGYYVALIDDNVPPQEEESDEFKDESLASLRLVQQEVNDLPDEWGAPCRTYLQERCRQFRGLIEELHKRYASSAQNGQTASVFVQTLENWERVVETTEQESQRIVAELKIDPDWLARIDANPDGLEEILSQQVTEMTKHAGDDAYQRASSGLIRVLTEQAERYKRSIANSLTRYETAKTELTRLRGLLADDAAVLFGESLGDDCHISASHYDKGVVLTSSTGKTNGSSSKDGDVLVLTDGIEGETVFRLRGRAIQRV